MAAEAPCPDTELPGPSLWRHRLSLFDLLPASPSNSDADDEAVGMPSFLHHMVICLFRALRSFSSLSCHRMWPVRKLVLLVSSRPNLMFGLKTTAPVLFVPADADFSTGVNGDAFDDLRDCDGPD
eukprot:CAMPEP_0117554578 /NCGR_PEP_ID=MMETSP0784-20121206/50827_1 /TAXON_ID=39447 /ORGANISM="" /LENGTH=124 /DNA_ID=CAMNT_0005351749 /DNA_START=268 /DNA_END=642 /DNA_ORIENTATION=+